MAACVLSRLATDFVAVDYVARYLAVHDATVIVAGVVGHDGQWRYVATVIVAAVVVDADVVAAA